MAVYSNIFNCSISENKSEAVLTFFQNTPIINDDGGLEGTSREKVATVILNGDTALELGEALVRLLKEE